MKKLYLFSLLLLRCLASDAQNDSSSRLPADSSRLKLNMDAVYDRPFLQAGKLPIALGGYAEANTNYQSTAGVSDGLSFQMRRLTLFVSSTIHKRLRFLTEIEFEDGTKELNIEFAALDFEFHPLLNLRGGIILNPIGSFNQNHDGPKWEFIDRPIAATQLLPATWSNAGFGLHGKHYHKKWVYAYELYLSNGFDDQVISNTENRTQLAATKLNRDRFEESKNGQAMLSAKLAVRNRLLGELGISYMGGVYNTFRQDGLALDKKRRLDVFALDLNTTLNSGTWINTELAAIWIDVPGTYTQQYGKKQLGGFIDIVHPVLKKKMLGFEKARLNTALRLEYTDWNIGRFKENGQNIGDEIWAVVPGISFRPSGQTVLRLNYRYTWQKDLLNNPNVKSAAIQFGFSTYF